MASCNLRARAWFSGGHRSPSAALLVAITCCSFTVAGACFGESAQTDEHGVVQGTYHFRLTKGQGIPVCEAFLKRLNSTKFSAPPYCGIPEQTSVPGFTILHRSPLNLDSVKELWSHVLWFTAAQQQFFSKPSAPSSIASDNLGKDLSVWRYSPPVSLTNDGKPTNLIIWAGPGAGLYVGSDYCGAISPPAYVPDRNPVLAYVLTPDDRSIDEVQTRALLGHPLGYTGPPVIPPPFPVLGDSEGVFEFSGLYYLYVFWNPNPGDLEGHGSNDPSMDNKLGVILEQHGQRKEMCRIDMSSDPPTNIEN